MKTNDDDKVETQRRVLADAFNQEVDPLAKHIATFESIDIDPFELYHEDVLSTKSLRPDTIRHYEAVFEQWCEFMKRQGRHPACPNEYLVKEFSHQLMDRRGNTADTVEKKLLRLNKAYEHWQHDPVFPHPQDYNPFRLAMTKLELNQSDPPDPPNLSVGEIAEILRGVTHIRDRAIILIQLKLGLRASEVANLEIQDLYLANREIQRFYEDMGTHWMVEEQPNSVCIPAKFERPGNKSKRPRLLPIDDELRRWLIRYLLVRPDADTQSLFLTKQNHHPIENDTVIAVWKEPFAEYAESGRYRAINSHYGRHFFTTYWTVGQDLNRELVKYMRGDVVRHQTLGDRGAIDDYIHTYYEDIESIYRKRIYKFNL